MTAPRAPFESRLAMRARIGWGMSVATPRLSMQALYEFGAGYPDPGSFPYDGMAEATAWASSVSTSTRWPRIA